MATEHTTQTEPAPGNNPFDGKVTDHSMAWAHVGSAYAISLAILFTYIVVISLRLSKARKNQESRR